MAYVGDTRSRKLLATLRAHGIGQVIVRGRLSGRRLDAWAYDNGAFEDWRGGRVFDAAAFEADLCSMPADAPPAFCVLPDIVAGGRDSVALSLEWLDRAPRHDWYFAVQDGMAADDVPWSRIAGVFVGGTLDWKLATGAAWVMASHSHGLPCHIGRVGTARRVAWASAIGADSIDSCLPLWGRDKLRLFLDALAQRNLFEAHHA